MKKGVVNVIIISAILLVSFLAIAGVHALDTSGVSSTLQTAQQSTKILTDQEASQEYIKQKWAEFFADTKVGKFLVAAKPYIKIFDPLFKFILGTEFEWNFQFFLSFGVAFAIVGFFTNTIELIIIELSKLFRTKLEYKNKYLKWLIPLALAVISSLSGITAFFVRIEMGIITNLFTSFLMQVIVVIVEFMIFVWVFAISGFVKSTTKNAEENYEKYLEEQELENRIKTLEKKTKNLKKDKEEDENEEDADKESEEETEK